VPWRDVKQTIAGITSSPRQGAGPVALRPSGGAEEANRRVIDPESPAELSGSLILADGAKKTPSLTSPFGPSPREIHGQPDPRASSGPLALGGERLDGAWNAVKSEGEKGVLTLLSLENKQSRVFIYIEKRVREPLSPSPFTLQQPKPAPEGLIRPGA
jgi:hypothetical protein